MLLDHIIIGVYSFLLLFLGIYNRSSNQNIRGYGKIDLNLQNKSLFLLATIFTNSVGGGTVFGLSEKVFLEDLSFAYAIMLTVLIDLLVAIFLVPRIADHYGVISVGEIVAKYYGKFGRIIAGTSATLVSFGYIAVQISASSRIFQYVLHVNYIEGVILSYLIVITYTAIGGLRSIIFTNFLQFAATIIFIPVVTFIGIYKTGLWNFAQSIPEAKYSIAYLWQDVLTLFLSFSLMGFYPGFIQRAFMTKDYHYTQKAIFGKSLIYIIFLVFISLNGLLTYCYYKDSQSNLALLYLINDLIPSGLKGLVIVGFLAAVMSTADSELNIASISLVNDVFGPIFKIHDSKIMLLFTQITTLVIGSLAIYLALSFGNIVDLLFFIAGFWLPVMLVPFIGCLYNISIGNLGLALSSTSGIITFICWQKYFADTIKLKGAFFGMIANLICFTIIRVLQKLHQRVTL
jgi:Na+/proline symporter